MKAFLLPIFLFLTFITAYPQDTIVSSSNANLSAITWPDIPNTYRSAFGWKGDTIPAFSQNKLHYKLTVPWDIDKIPALVAKTADPNAKIQVQRALNLSGNVSERTIKFICTAEDDTTTNVYEIVLTKDCSLCSPQQPWKGEPFFSQYVFRQASCNDFLEIVNPGNQIPLDLSDYMVTFGNYNSPEEAITRLSGAGDWNNRYNKYIPGYKWVNKATWATTPARVEKDLNINPIVNPHQVFVLANIQTDSTSATHPRQAVKYVNIDFNHNPWGDSLSAYGQTMYQSWGQKIMLFKILNDSIKTGMKAANDPKDFKLIDVIGDSAGVRWVIGGRQIDANSSWFRYGDIYKGNPVIQASFGSSSQICEWSTRTELDYVGYPWPLRIIMVADGIGSHDFYTTHYKSTITSYVYKVSEGFSKNETVKGINLATSVNTFYSNIIKADTGQYLKVKRSTDEIILKGSDIISQGDTLIVVSSDSTNTSKYYLDLTPLSNNALLTSTLYTITVNDNKGTISNFNYNTDLKTVFDGVIVPANASMEIIDTSGAYVPFRILNADTIYMIIKVSDRIRFVVTAEDRTQIIYQLQPDVTNNDAFITSNIYDVNQSLSIIQAIPAGTSAKTLYSNIIPARGASFKITDKYDLERTSGYICRDDKVKVTAADGVTTKTYYLYSLPNDTCPYPCTTRNEFIYKDNQIKIYPNPAKEYIQITGIVKGMKIRIFNMLGEPVLVKEVFDTTETISMNSLPKGVYIVKVSFNKGKEVYNKIILQ